MLTMIAKFGLRPGKRAAATRALARLAAAVRSEPGTLVYLCHVPDRSAVSLPTPPDEIVFYEVYRDAKALQAHVSGAAFQAFTAAARRGKWFVEDFSGQAFVQIENLTRVAGFVRPPRKPPAPSSPRAKRAPARRGRRT